MELVDVAAVVAVAVRVAMVLTPCQPGLGPSPMGLAPPRVLEGMSRLLRGLYPPAFGLSLVREHCLMHWILLSHQRVFPLVAHQWSPFWLWSFFALPPLLGLLWIGVFLRFGGLPRLCLLGFLPGWRVPWIHPLPHQVLVLSVSFVVVLSLPVCPGPPPVLWPHQGRLCVSG